MGFIELFLLAVSLAMDAFAVSICGSMVLSPEDRKAGALRFGIWFGGFQALMPIIGYFGAISFIDYIKAYDHWIAFALLGYLGINMIREGLDGDEEEVKSSYSTKEMAVLAIATSIDALAVGVSFAFLEINIWLAATLIGVVTLVISTFGGMAGFKLGAAVGQRANIVGGVVLLCIGIKIVLEHTGFLG